MDESAMRRRAKRRGGPAARWGTLVMMLCLVSALTLAGCASSISQEPAPTPSPTSSPTPRPLTCQGAYEESNPIAAENTCPGTTAWNVTLPHGPEDAIEGYVSPARVDASGTVNLYVSTTAPTYTFAVYRMGFYQGTQARLMYKSPVMTGRQQSAPTLDPATRMVECSWQHPASIVTARSWVSGMYLVKLISSSGYQRYTFFVVRNTTVPTPILYTLPFLTYQAYNLWGDYSLYYHRLPDGSYDKTQPSYAVSFDRPYLMGSGLSLFGLYDLPLLSWLESHSYNMTYEADFDLDATLTPLNQYKLIIVSGHAEYWSLGMRANITQARDAGVSLAFFGSNDVYWHVRLSASPLGMDRIVVCYRYASLDPVAIGDPQEATVRWRDPPLNQPEAELLGEQYQGQVQAPAPLVLDTGSAPYLTGTSLAVGSSFPDLVGGEFDRVDPQLAPAGLQVIATSPVLRISSNAPDGVADTANATLYVAPSGARVFDAGTFRWSWSLNTIQGGSSVNETTTSQISPENYANAGLQQMTANILDALLR